MNVQNGMDVTVFYILDAIIVYLLKLTVRNSL